VPPGIISLIQQKRGTGEGGVDVPQLGKKNQKVIKLETLNSNY
jgi:hypothetical protein